MIKIRPHFPLAVLLVVIWFLSSYSSAAVQNASPSPTPPGPPPTNIPSVPTGKSPAASPTSSPQPGSGAASTQPGGQNQPQNTARPVDPAKLQRARQPLQKTPPPNPQPTPKPGSDTYIFDWNNGSATPDTVYNSGRSALRITNVNDILYSYSVKVTPIVQSTDDLSQWSDLIQSTIKALTSQANQTAPNAGGTCNLASVLGSETQSLTTIKTKLDQMEPTASGTTKCSSIPVNRTISDWKTLRSKYDEFESGLADVQAQISNPDCASDPQLGPAMKLIVDQFPPLQQQVSTIQKKVDSPHFQEISYDLKRTSDYDISVVEACDDGPTDHAAVAFHLNHGHDVLTLSGGFLLTKLQARSYSVVSSPVPSPTPGAAPTAQNVLSVDGLGSGMRAALVALFNYHDPFEWFGNRPNFGLAVSAGPVFDISQGKADTSKFGAFVGGSVHLWNRLFITPGVHFGEFADFPQGFHAAGDPVPANFGTPTPTKRWTGHFALGITFKGKDLSGLTPGTNNAGSGASTPQSSK